MNDKACIYCNAENCVHNEGNGQCSARDTMEITIDGYCIDYAPSVSDVRK